MHSGVMSSTTGNGGPPPGNLVFLGPNWQTEFERREAQRAQSPDVAFRDVLARSGFEPGAVIADSKIHRFAGPEERRGRRSGWYVLHVLGDLAYGAFGDWRHGKHTWCSRDLGELAPAERAEMDQRLRTAKEQRERRQKEAETEAMARLRAARAGDGHPYLVRKKIGVHGLTVDEEGWLLVPVVDEDGTMRSLQRISPTGTKLFLAGGRTRGCCCVIGEPGRTVYLAEGYATAVTVHEVTGQCAVAAFSAGNLTPVARVLRARWPTAHLVVAADNDRKTEGNPGLTQGQAAAAAVGGRCVAPVFAGDQGTDFNDLAVLEGVERVRGQLEERAVRLMPATRWAGKVVPPREWLLESWIPMQQTTALYGDGGTGKTLLAQQIGTVVSLGLPFLGIPTTGGVVLGYFCEDSDEELHRRQADINAWARVDYPALGRWYPVSRAGEDNLLMTYDAGGTGRLTPFWAEMAEAVAELRPVLLIVDTAADVFGGNENVRTQVRQFIQGALTRIAIEYRCAVLLLAHPSVAGIQSGEGTGGNTAWNNTVRSRLYLEREEGDIATYLTRKKANYASRGERIELHWAEGAFWQSGSKLAAKAIENSDQAAFLACLRRAMDQNQNVGTNEKGNYAPRMFLRYPEGRGANLRRLEKAMYALIDDGVIAFLNNDKGRPYLQIIGYAPKRMGTKGAKTPPQAPTDAPT